jgi:hypothetical protein
MKRISELTKEMSEKLQELAPGAFYHALGCTESGLEIVRGPHFSVYVPSDVEFNAHQVEGLFNLYHTDVKWDGVLHETRYSCAKGWFNEMKMDILPLPDLEKLNEEAKEKANA